MGTISSKKSTFRPLSITTGTTERQTSTRKWMKQSCCRTILTASTSSQDSTINLVMTGSVLRHSSSRNVYISRNILYLQSSGSRRESVSSPGLRRAKYSLGTPKSFARQQAPSTETESKQLPCRNTTSSSSQEIKRAISSTQTQR